MSELIRRIPGEQSLVGAIRGVADTSRQFNSRQRISGRGGQLGYVIESDDEWDLVETFPTTPAFTALPAEYRLTFTGDGSQKYPIVQPATDIRVNGTGEANKLSLNFNGRYWYVDGSNIVQEYYIDEPDAADFESENKLSWLIALEYSGSITLRMKARGRGSSNGTWSIERIA